MTDYQRYREADASAVYKSWKRFICVKALIVNGEGTQGGQEKNPHFLIGSTSQYLYTIKVYSSHRSM